MKICSSTLIGPLDKLSYQYSSKAVINNLTTHFDHAYFISSTRKNKTIPSTSKNFTLISDTNSWFKKQKGKEVFSFEKLVNNLQRIFELAHHENYDFLTNISINQYIDKENYNRLRSYCNKLFLDNQPFGWRYSAYQILDKISYPRTKTPWVINLRHPDFKHIKFNPDSLFFKDRLYKRQTGFYSKAPFYIIDVYVSMNKKDFHERYHLYLKHLTKYASGEEGDEDWEKIIQYYQIKGNQMVINPKTKL